MSLYIDRETCTGCGICTDICPETFEMGDDQHAHVMNSSPDSEHIDCARTAVNDCPVDAIHMQ